MSIGSIANFSVASALQHHPKRASRLEQDLSTALEQAGVDSAKIPDVLSQIEDAIKNSVSGDKGEPGIRDAVDNVLQANGVDVAKFDAALQALHPKGHHGDHHDGDQVKNGLATALKSIGVDDSKITDLLQQIKDAVGQAHANGSNTSQQPQDSFLQIINQMLQKNGVDTDQFDNAFKAQLSQKGALVDVQA